MQITTCKKSTKSLNPIKRYWGCFFREPWVCQTIPNKNNLCNYMQQINKIAQTFPELLATWYFGECWSCPCMSDHGILSPQEIGGNFIWPWGTLNVHKGLSQMGSLKYFTFFFRGGDNRVFSTGVPPPLEKVKS